MFLVEPDKSDIKRHYSMHYALLEGVTAKRESNKRKAISVLFDFADVANVSM